MGKLLKRLRWRWNNLTLKDFINSYASVKTIELPDLDIEGYDSYSQNNVELLEDYSPFILIKPSGVEHEDKIKQLLQDVEIEKEETIDNYIELGLNLYHRPNHNRKHTLNSYLWFALDEYIYPDKLDQTKVFFVNEIENVREFKKQIRLEIGHIKFYNVCFKDLKDQAFSSFIHISDKEDLQREYSILMNYLKNERRT